MDLLSVIAIGPDSYYQLNQDFFVFWVNLCEDHSGTGLSQMLA